MGNIDDRIDRLGTETISIKIFNDWISRVIDDPDMARLFAMTSALLRGFDSITHRNLHLIVTTIIDV